MAVKASTIIQLYNNNFFSFGYPSCSMSTYTADTLNINEILIVRQCLNYLNRSDLKTVELFLRKQNSFCALLFTFSDNETESFVIMKINDVKYKIEIDHNPKVIVAYITIDKNKN